MIARVYLLVGLVLLSAFAYGQYQGIGFFDDTATSRSGYGGHGGSGGRIFHK